jgi:hypothetical protein
MFFYPYSLRAIVNRKSYLSTMPNALRAIIHHSSFIILLQYRMRSAQSTNQQINKSTNQQINKFYPYQGLVLATFFIVSMAMFTSSTI